LALLVWALAGFGVQAAALPDSTWVQLPTMPIQGDAPLFALAVDPAHNQVLVAGDSRGALMRSTNGGATWAVVHSGPSPVISIAFNPLQPAQVLAGTRGSGALISGDGGATWAETQGLENREVRAFGFALTVVVAGTDRGVFVSPDGAIWRPSGLAKTPVSTIAISAIHIPIRVVAGSDLPASQTGPALYQSLDAGNTWSSLSPGLSGTTIAHLAAGAPLPTGNVRPLVVGTNAGLFISTDNGAHFTPLSGGIGLPSTDYTQIAFVTTHPDRFYVASDGGGSGAGGLWATSDMGKHFRTLIPPLRSITALAISNDEAPIIYAATFRTADHATGLWAYHDTGAAPKGPAVTPSPVVIQPVAVVDTSLTAQLRQLVQSSQAPYLALGGFAILLILLAMVSNLRARRR